MARRKRIWPPPGREPKRAQRRRRVNVDLGAEAVAYDFHRPLEDQLNEDRHFDATSMPDYVDANRVPHWTGDIKSAIRRRDKYLAYRGYSDRTQKGS